MLYIFCFIMSQEFIPGYLCVFLLVSFSFLQIRNGLLFWWCSMDCKDAFQVSFSNLNFIVIWCWVMSQCQFWNWHYWRKKDGKKAKSIAKFVEFLNLGYTTCLNLLKKRCFWMEFRLLNSSAPHFFLNMFSCLLFEMCSNFHFKIF